MDTVFVVACSSGSHDSYCWWIGGIFGNLQDAEDLKDKLNAKAEAIQKLCPPFDEDSEEYWDYLIANEKYMEWGGANVLEFPFNEALLP